MLHIHWHSRASMLCCLHMNFVSPLLVWKSRHGPSHELWLCTVLWAGERLEKCCLCGMCVFYVAPGLRVFQGVALHGSLLWCYLVQPAWTMFWCAPSGEFCCRRSPGKGWCLAQQLLLPILSLAATFMSECVFLVFLPLPCCTCTGSVKVPPAGTWQSTYCFSLHMTD